MNISNKNHLHILDLPNEILFMIFKKLNMVDVLYSFVDVTQRFDQLIFDPFYIPNLNLTSMTMKSYLDRIYSIDDQILSKICKNILPRIHDQVNELIIEQNSTEHVLHTINYPQLYSLSLVDFEEEVFLKHLRDNTILRKLLTEQITCLQIDINGKNTATSPFQETVSTIFGLILSLCNRLIKLNFCESDYRLTTCTFDLSTNYKSSTLTVLKISVKTSDDCLYLLDGRLNCLSTLIIDVEEIRQTSGTIDNTENLPELKYFSVRSFPRTVFYDDLIIPLLRRMINLEELRLFLPIIRTDSNYIDGTQLYDDILIYMPRLNKFNFNIDTTIIKNNSELVVSSNEDIQHSFNRKEYGLIASHVETFSKENESRGHAYSPPWKFNGRCHIYSLPYQFKFFFDLNNSFQGGMFDNVKVLAVTDLRPFEHNFFKVISKIFPLLKRLYIFNNQPQIDKQQSITSIVFSHLISLNLYLAHADYAKQFLTDKHCHLPCLLNLDIGYEPLALVTNNFTNDATRLTCGKLTCLRIEEPFVPPKDFHQYFPLL